MVEVECKLVVYLLFELRPNQGQVNVLDILCLLDADLIEVQDLLEVKVFLKSLVLVVFIICRVGIAHNIDVCDRLNNIIDDRFPVCAQVSELGKVSPLFVVRQFVRLSSD